MAGRDEILEYCAVRLSADSYQDVAINGLQAEGAFDIRRIAVGVSTSDYTISAAAEWDADALLVHHGLLWGSRPQSLTGLLGRRLKRLFQHDINLIGYHLPLDGHPEIGNNALLAQQMGLTAVERFGAVAGMPLGFVCETEEALTLADLLGRIAGELGRTPVTVGDPDTEVPLQRIGILSGSGYGMLAEAASLGCQALVTGDLREPSMAEARELGVVAVAAGHEATERLGVQALADELCEHFGIESRFFPDPNPV